MKTTKLCSVICASLVLFTNLALATALTPNPSLDIEGVGLTIETGGTGLEPGSGVIAVDIGGPVVTAVLYWTARDFPCEQDSSGVCLISGADDELLVDGTLIVADRVVGTEECGSDDVKYNNIGYAADVTAQVASKGTGPQFFMVEDADIEDLFRLNGAGMLLVYADPANSGLERVIIYEGLDFAYTYASPDAAKVTEPVVFMFDPAPSDRAAVISVFAGDAEAGRPDRISINGSSIFNELNGDEGSAFDVDDFPFIIAASETQLTVQLFSETNSTLTSNPDSILWEVGALRLSIPVEEGATGRMTGGRNIRIGGAKIGGVRGGMTIHCDITLSNNIQVSWGQGPNRNTWHLEKPISSALCIDDPEIDPIPPVAPFDTFIGKAIGRLNNVDGSAMAFTFVDAGEPGRDDYAEITIWAPGDDPAVDPAYFSVAGFLEGGNLNAHFDQPHSGNGN